MHTFFTVEGGDSEFVNFILPTLKAFWEARSQNVSGYRMPQDTFFPQRNRDHLVSQKNDWKTLFFPTLHHLSTVIFATATVMAFVLLRNSRFNFHCYTQCEATPTQKLAQKWLRPLMTSCMKDYKGHSLMQTSFTGLPIVRAKIHSWWCGGEKADHNACFQVFSSATTVVPRAKPKLAQPCSSTNWLGT